MPARHAGRAGARHQPPQPRAADHPARGRRRHDHAPGAVPVRARARARRGGRRPPRRRALAAGARRRHGDRAAGALLASSPATARCASSRSARSPAACACSSCRVDDGDPELEARLRGAVAQALGEAGADARVEVERCSELARRGGKLQIVVACRAKLCRVNVAAPAGAGRARRGRARRMAWARPRPRRAREGARRRARGAPRPAADVLRGAALACAVARPASGCGWPSWPTRAAQPLRHDAPDRPARARGHGRAARPATRTAAAVTRC